MIVEIIIIILGILALSNGVSLLFFPRFAMNVGKSWNKNKKQIKRIGIIEIVFGCIFLATGILMLIFY